MSEIFKELNRWGCKVDDALNRLVNDEALFVYCIKAFSEDEGFKTLETCIEKQDYIQAFTTAHTLKGVAGNLSLTPLYDSISVIVEALRNKQYNDINQMCSNIMAHFNNFRNIAVKFNT